MPGVWEPFERPRRVPRKMVKHQAYVNDLSRRCQNVVELVVEYFKPPNGMTWSDPDSGWEVVIRRKAAN